MRASYGLGLVMGTAFGAALLTTSCGGPTGMTVDPGANFVIPSTQFNQNYFYCVVEPEIIMGGLTKKPCGDDGSHGCHYSDKVPEMALVPVTPPVQCSNGVPTNASQVAGGSPASTNFSSVSLQMSATYTNANIYLWPTQIVPGHPVQVYSQSDAAVVKIIMTWASM